MSDAKIDTLKLAPGTRVGVYEVVELVADGGFGYLYRVRRDDRFYALKISRYSFAGMDAEDRVRDEERLDREIAALKTLRHPNIVRVHAFDRWPDLEGGFPFLVMEFVEGDRLDLWQRSHVSTLAELVTLYEKIALAVEHIHEHGIFHRDLKAQNIVVRDDREPVLLDFGIARPRYSHDVTRAGLIGSVTHFAPEYVKWSDSATSASEAFQWQAATDLHSYGYMLYEALAGRPPFPRGTKSEPASESEILVAIKKVVPKRPSVWNPKVPAALDELVMQLLSKDPAKRPGSAADVAAALGKARDEAQASGDQIWDVPFDLPARAAASTPGKGGAQKDEPGPDASGDDPSPATSAPKERVDGEIQVPVIPERGSRAEAPAFTAPTRQSQGDYVDEDADRPTGGKSGKPDPLDAALADVKAQVEASAPRKRLNLALMGGITVVIALLIIVVLGGRGSGVREGPKTLLAMAEAEPGSGVAPAPPTSLPIGAPEVTGPETGAAGLSEPSAPVRKAEPSRQERARSAVPPNGRTRPRPSPVTGEAPSGPMPASAPATEEPTWLQRSRRLAGASAPPAGSPTTRGVPYGAHVRAKLLTNLDSRTIGSGPVEALLDVPFVVRGEIALPVRTLAYGTATETNGRFTVRFTRLRFPDDTELAFEGLALARDDGKPGLAAARRIERPPEQRESVGTSIAKGTGNILLDTIAGGTAEALAKNAGRAVVNKEAPSQKASDSQWAILLDAGVVFDIWIERAF